MSGGTHSERDQSDAARAELVKSTALLMEIVTFALLLFSSLMILAGAVDVMTLRIPQWLTLLIATAFFPLAVLSGMPSWLIMLHGTAGVVLLVFGFLLFAFGVVGSGDAKLLAAGGLWLGLPGSVAFLGFTALTGGVLAFMVGILFLLNVEANSAPERISRFLQALRPDVPYGFALAAGAILALPFSWWMNAALG